MIDVKAALDDAIEKINAGIGERIEHAVNQRDQRWRAKIGDVVAEKVAAAVRARDAHWQAFVKEALDNRDAEWRELTGHTGEFPPTPEDTTEDATEFEKSNIKYINNVIELFPQKKEK